MTTIKTFICAMALVVFQGLCSISQAQTSGIPFIKVDQFGYLPGAENENTRSENLLTNPGAEGGVSPCYTFASGPAIQQSDAQSHSGNYSFLSANRTQYYHGPAFNLKPLVTDGQLLSGERYTFSVWVFHGESSAKNLHLNIKKVDGSGTKYITIENENLPQNSWTLIENHYVLAITGTLSSLELYVVTDNGQNFDFYSDDFFVGETETYDPPASSAATDFIKTSGKQLVVGASATPIVLNGINVTIPTDASDTPNGIWATKAISEKDFQNIANLGFNSIRLLMNYIVFEDDAGPGVFKDDGWAWLDRAIALAKNAGLYVMLDMHVPQGGYQSDKPQGFSAFWDGSGSTPNTSNQDRLIALWAAIADRYKHETAILGYDLINEPRPNNSEEWYSYAEQIIAAIRVNDANHTIVVEVPFIPNYTIRTVNDNNVLYDSHFYYTWGYATQYSAAYGNGGQQWGKYDPADPVYVDWNGNIVSQGTPNSEAFDDSYLENYLLGDLLTFTSVNSVPANVGEFGIVWEAYAEDVGAMQYMRDLYKLLDGNNPTEKTVSRFYFSYQGTFGLYNNWNGFHTDEDEVSENLKDFFGNHFEWTGSNGTSWQSENNWTTGLSPDELSNVIVPDVTTQPIISGPGEIQVNNLTINANATLDIASNGELTVIDEIANSGTLVINSDVTGTASLIHHNTGVTATVERYISAWTSNEHGWHFLSSPVAGQAIQPDFVPNPPTSDQDFYKWDEPSATWINSKMEDGGSQIWNTNFENNFLIGRGYLVAYQNNQTKTFAQVINVEDLSLTNLSKSGGNYSGWHLLGNPFPSAIKWNDGNWNMTNIAGTAKIWNESNASYTDIPANGIIPAMNGFMVQVIESAGSLTIPAAARTHDDQSWYKNSGYPEIKLLVKDLEQNTAQESVILFHPEATEGFDPDSDSRFLAGYAPQFYSVADGESVSVNALNYWGENLEIPFHFIKNTSSDFEISMLENSTGEEIFMEDLKTGKLHYFNENEGYQFTSEGGDPENRFILKFSNTNIADFVSNKIVIQVSGNQVEIFDAKDALIEVFNITGQLLFREHAGVENFKTTFSFRHGVYLLRVQKGQSVSTRKVYINP
jgi:aryl-phospho-beta-D-glucosidase BglC (GH1 family)